MMSAQVQGGFLAELKEIVVADAVLIFAFTLTLVGGITLAFRNSQAVSLFVLYLPIVAIGVTLSFVLHELMHKFVAQRYGAVAGFRYSTMGLAITLITGAFGFLLGIPGATMIYAQNFTKRENGIVSLAGPLTNFAVFAGALGLGIVLSPLFFQYSLGSSIAIPASQAYLFAALRFTMFISLILAFFNMLPIVPLDGSKVFAWNLPIYAIVMAGILSLIWAFSLLSTFTLLYMLAIALLLSVFYRRMF